MQVHGAAGSVEVTLALFMMLFSHTCSRAHYRTSLQDCRPYGQPSAAFHSLAGHGAVVNADIALNAGGHLYLAPSFV